MKFSLAKWAITQNNETSSVSIILDQHLILPKEMYKVYYMIKGLVERYKYDIYLIDTISGNLYQI